jgi:hypothetical protein
MSTAEKAHKMRQVRAEKANASEPLLKCRKRMSGLPKPGSSCCPGMNLAGSCIPGQVAARHEGGASSATGASAERGNPSPRCCRLGFVGVWLVSRENSKQLKLQGAEYRCVAGGRTVS